MCSSSAPTPPDPKETAAAQTGSNIGTAVAQQTLNQTNQVTPQGSLNYAQSGTYKYTDPATGQTYDVPQYTATTSYSPAEQSIYDTGVGTRQNLADVASNESAFLKDYLGKNVDLSATNLDKYVNSHYTDDFNTQWDKSATDYAQSLSDRGIKMGSDAYTRAQSDFSTNKSNAYDNLLGSMYGNAQSAILAERNQPINELTALTSGSQVSNPSFGNTPQTNVANTDYAGLVNSNYQQQLAQWQQQQQQKQAMLGGLFSLGSAGIAAIP